VIRALALSFVFCCIAIGPSKAAQACSQPYAPQIPDGKTASSDDIEAARRDAKAFIAASDVYQECLGSRYPINERAATANQSDKERIGREFNKALAAFKMHQQVQVAQR
jgi:hypothetical protein